LEGNTIIGSSFLSVGNLIYNNVKLLGISQEKIAIVRLGAILELHILQTAEKECF